MTRPITHKENYSDLSEIEDDSELLRILKRKNEELKKREAFLKSINHFSASLLGKTDLREIAWIITQRLISQYEFEDCVIYVKKEDGYLYQVAAYGPKNPGGTEITEPIRIKVGDGIVGSVAQTGQAVIIEDTTQDERYIVDDEPRLSELTVPIIADHEVIGIIDSEHSQKAFYTIEHLKTIQMIANLVSLQIKNAVITENQLLAQQALQDNEAKLKAIINSSLDAIITIDQSGVITEWNERAEEIFGYKQEEVLGVTLSQTIVPHQYREAHERGMKHFLATGQGPVLNHRIEIVGLRKDGTEFPIELTISPFQLDGKYHFSSFVRDISEQKEAEAELKRNEAKYRGIIDNMELGLLEVDLEERIKYANPSFCHMTGYEAEELLGMNASQLLLDEEEAQAMASQNAQRKDGEPGVYELKIKNKSGKHLWGLISGAPLHDRNGKIKGSIGIHLDITDRKELEENLEKALSKERELNDLKSQFVSMTSHEFRTPLTTLKANIELLNFYLQSVDSPLKPKIENNCQRMESEINRLTGLMNDILTLGRVESNRIPFQPQMTDLVKLCEELKDSTKISQEDGRELELDVEGKPFELEIDRGLFHHVLTNLVSNSFKYSAGCANPVMTLNFDHHKLSLSVRDFGIGISKKDQQSLFQSFYRASNTHGISGSGLGLSIVNRLVDLHKGKVSVESKLNQGSTFTIELNKN